MEHHLRARLIRHVPSPDGKQADIVLIEPSGDEHKFCCLIRRTNQTEIGGDGEILAYLNKRYGAQEVCSTAKGPVLEIDDLPGDDPPF